MATEKKKSVQRPGANVIVLIRAARLIREAIAEDPVYQPQCVFLDMALLPYKEIE